MRSMTVRRLIKNTLLGGLLMTWVAITSLRMCGAAGRFFVRHEHVIAVPIGEGFADPGGAWHAYDHDPVRAPESVVDVVGAYLTSAMGEPAAPACTSEEKPIN